MSDINWKKKLTSRKFWLALIGFVTAILTVFNVNSLTQEQVISIISACSILVAYILGEGATKRARINKGGK